MLRKCKFFHNKLKKGEKRIDYKKGVFPEDFEVNSIFEVESESIKEALDKIYYYNEDIEIGDVVAIQIGKSWSRVGTTSIFANYYEVWELDNHHLWKREQ